jgi:hypothetical protein
MADEKKQVQSTRKNQGADFYKRIGSKGGQHSKTKFNSDTGRAAVLARWEKYRLEQYKKLRKAEHESSNGS